MPEYLRAEYERMRPEIKYETLLQFCNESLATHPEDKDYLNAYAAIYLEYLRRHEECITHCRAVLPEMKEEECIEDTQRFLVYALKETGKVQEAIEVLKVMAGREKKASFATRDLIELYEKVNDIDNAIKWYEKTAAQGPMDAEEYNKLYSHYDSKQDYINSIKYMELSARTNTDEGYWAWCNVGRAYALMGKLEEADFYFRMSMKLNPDYEWPHYYLGMSYQNKNDFYRALHHYNEALKRKPQFPEVQNNLASIKFEDDGDVQGAIDLLQKALEEKPEGPIVTTLYLNLSRLYKKIADYDKHEFYKGKMMESLGFPVEFTDDEEGDGDVLK